MNEMVTSFAIISGTSIQFKTFETLPHVNQCRPEDRVLCLNLDIDIQSGKTSAKCREIDSYELYSSL